MQVGGSGGVVSGTEQDGSLGPCLVFTDPIMAVLVAVSTLGPFFRCLERLSPGPGLGLPDASEAQDRRPSGVCHHAVGFASRGTLRDQPRPRL